MAFGEFCRVCFFVVGVIGSVVLLIRWRICDRGLEKFGVGGGHDLELYDARSGEFLGGVLAWACGAELVGGWGGGGVFG